MRIPSNSPDMRNPNWTAEEKENNESSHWSAEDNKIFERALALYDKNSADYLQKVAAAVPGKTIGDVKRQIEVLMQDIQNIEAGFVAVPDYDNASPGFSWDYGVSSAATFQVSEEPFGRRPCPSRRYSDPGRKKGVPWTEEEHRMFLVGLEKCGKGDWRTISRDFVVTRTPTQVASHAQKFFLRQNTAGKERRRSSIHDITTPMWTPSNIHDITSSPTSSSSPNSLPPHTCHRYSSHASHFNHSSPPQHFHSSSPLVQFNQSFPPPQLISQSSSTSQFNQSNFSPQQFHHQSSSPSQFHWSQQQDHVGGVAMDALSDVPLFPSSCAGTFMPPPPYVSEEFRMPEEQMGHLDDLVRQAQSQNMRRNGHAV